MADESVAIIISASITASVALGGIVTTVLAGGHQQRKTLEHAATQARLAREAEAQREAHNAAQRRYERVRGILEPHVALAREMRSTSGSWAVIPSPETLEGAIDKIVQRVQLVSQIAEQRRGDFEIEPGLGDLLEIFVKMQRAYNRYAVLIQNRAETDWVVLSLRQLEAIEAESDLFITNARALVTALDAAQA